MSAKHPARNAIIISLVILASIFFGLRHFAFSKMEPTGDRHWQITMTGEYTAASDQSVISLATPIESPRRRLISRKFQHPGLKVQAVKMGGASRWTTFSSRGAGQFLVIASFEVQTSETERFFTPPAILMLSDRERESYLALEPGHEDIDLDSIAEQLGLSKLDKEQAIIQIVNYLFKLKTAEGTNSSMNLAHALETKSLTERDKAELLVALARWLHIPSRLVSGLELKDDPDAQPTYWVDVYLDNKWRAYHPAHGYLPPLPANYLSLDKSGQGLFMAEQEDMFNLLIEIEQLPYSSTAYIASAQQKHWYDIFHFERLSVEARDQLMYLMLLPLGALITACIRHFVGIHSYGVFTPTMLALAMIYTDRITTLAILLITIVAVYIGRPAFHSSVSRTPRLSIIFTFVAVSMLVGVSLLDYFSLGKNQHLILLPIVIITSLIDRFFAVAEENGTKIALVRLAWTALISLLIVPVLQYEWLGYHLLTAPELHLYTVAFLLLLSEYDGKQLVDHPYFRVLREDYWKAPSELKDEK